MAVRIFDLSGVSQEEANGVRRALTERGIDFYETPEGDWMRAPAIWVKRDADTPSARAAIDTFQRQWRDRVRQRGRKPELLDWRRPGHIVLVIVVLAVLIMMFFYPGLR